MVTDSPMTTRKKAISSREEAIAEMHKLAKEQEACWKAWNESVHKSYHGHRRYNLNARMQHLDYPSLNRGYEICKLFNQLRLKYNIPCIPNKLGRYRRVLRPVEKEKYHEQQQQESCKTEIAEIQAKAS